MQKVFDRIEAGYVIQLSELAGAIDHSPFFQIKVAIRQVREAVLLIIPSRKLDRPWIVIGANDSETRQVFGHQIGAVAGPGGDIQNDPGLPVSEHANRPKIASEVVNSRQVLGCEIGRQLQAVLRNVEFAGIAR